MFLNLWNTIIIFLNTCMLCFYHIYNTERFIQNNYAISVYPDIIKEGVRVIMRQMKILLSNSEPEIMKVKYRK